MTRYALISVSDKRGVVEFARALRELGFEIISTGGTARALMGAGILPRPIWEVTGFPEILDGRVKTLHPKIHGGLLARRDDSQHMSTLREQGIEPIDLVCVNLYPFAETVARPDVTLDEAVENIDIGGPSMIRSAAKNWAGVIVVVNPDRYPAIIESLKAGGPTEPERRRLALEAFQHTAAYDAAIAAYLLGQVEPGRDAFPPQLSVTLDKAQDLRYGENPHQRGAFYRLPGAPAPNIAASRQLQGKELSYNNILDATAAFELVREFEAPAAVTVKHTNPCGVAVRPTLAEAFRRAYEADTKSIFGGIVALNRPCDLATAKLMKDIFLEVLIAPKFERDALDFLARKKDLRILETGHLSGTGMSPEHAGRPDVAPSQFEFRRVSGGLLVQDLDRKPEDPATWRVVSRRPPTGREWEDASFGWKVVKHVKSNAIVVAADRATLGVGAGQMNRIDAARHALDRAGEQARGAVLASDAFFPFPDVVEAAAAAGVSLIIQPGGSIRDEASIEAADRLGLSMLFTGVRHFRH